MKFCQSCGMPLEDGSDLFGTESDGTLSSEYCCYCYQNGQFTADISLEQMIDFCVPLMIKAHPEMSEADARSMMQKFMPQLKRWRPSDSRSVLEQKAEAILEKCPMIVLNSITDNGYPRGCVLVKVANEGFKKIYVATGTSSRKTGHFLKNPKAGVCYSEGSDGVTLTGMVRILGEEEKKVYWQEWMKDHFPLGINDPDFCVLEFSTQEATFWIDQVFETYQY